MNISLIHDHKLIDVVLVFECVTILTILTNSQSPIGSEAAQGHDVHPVNVSLCLHPAAYSTHHHIVEVG